MKQTFLFNLGYDKIRNKFIKANIIVDCINTYIYYLYSDNEDFDNIGCFSPAVIYNTADFLVNKKKSKNKFLSINSCDIENITEIKSTKINFYLPLDLFNYILESIDQEIIIKMRINHLEPLSELYFQEMGALLTPYENIIKIIKKDNAIKKMLKVDIFPISYYRPYIDKYFPKISNNSDYDYKYKNHSLLQKFNNKTFDECFNFCESIEDVINLSQNITCFLNLKYITSQDYVLSNIKKYIIFLTTIMVYIYENNNKKNIQTIIDVMNNANLIYNNNIYNEFSSDIINYYKKYGNNNILIYLYKKSYGNKTYIHIDNIYKNLQDLCHSLEYIEGSDNFYKYQNIYLENINKEKENELKKQNNKYEELIKQYNIKKKHFNLLSIISATTVGGITAMAVIINKIRKK